MEDKIKKEDIEKEMEKLGLLNVVRIPIKLNGGCQSGCNQNNNNVK